MKLKQIIEDEFGDLDDQDDFGGLTLEIDPKSISYKKRKISYGPPYDTYTNEVLFEYMYNDVLISNVVSRSLRNEGVVINWWINDEPLDLMDYDRIINIVKKLKLDDFITSKDLSSAHIFLLDVLNDTAEYYL